MKLDILCFGAHPDDVEIGMGATIASFAEKGYKIGICNLTKGELSSNGTVQTRQKEAEKAAEILGVTKRIQLHLKDRHLQQVTEEKLQTLVSIIRRYQPDVVFSPYTKDRHPDHGACSKLITEAVFNARIRRYTCAQKLNAWSVMDHHYYFINGFTNPDFVIDISNWFETKQRALLAYESQFTLNETSVQTPLTDDYITVVQARDRLFGKEVGVTFAEGFKTTKPLLLSQLGRERVDRCEP